MSPCSDDYQAPPIVRRARRLPLGAVDEPAERIGGMVYIVSPNPSGLAAGYQHANSTATLER